MDLVITYNNVTFGFDFSIVDGDLSVDDGLRTAVLVSLFTDRRAADDDELPAGSDDRRGYWGDAYAEIKGDLTGSRLWLLSRAKVLPETLARAREYAEEALAWLTEDKVARAVNVTAVWVDNVNSAELRGVLGLRVAITLADGSRWADVFNYPLSEAA